MKFQEEKFLFGIKEAIPLLHAHWKEIALHQDKRPLDPNFKGYKELEDLGLLRIYTARTDKLEGYAIFFIHPSLHYQTWIEAHNDIYYLRPEERKGTMALKFFKFCEAELIKLNVNAIYYPDKIRTTKDKLFQRLGYHAMETKYEKVL